jgi:hypothetical protein
MPHLLNNTVIKNLSPEMGKEIIQVYKDDGWDTRSFEGAAFAGHSTYYHYGVIDGDFDNHCLQRVDQANAQIITLEQAKQIINPMKQKQITLTVEQAKDILNDPDGIKALIRANFTEQELKGRVKKWEELGRISGWYVHSPTSTIDSVDCGTTDYMRNVYATEAQALAFGIAAPMLSQLMKEKNGDWVADWGAKKDKFIIGHTDNELRVYSFCTTKRFLAFPTSLAAQEFLSDHRYLITQYFAGF